MNDSKFENEPLFNYGNEYNRKEMPSIMALATLRRFLKTRKRICATTTKDFMGIPWGTKLWFGISNDGRISTFDRDVKERNKEFNYDFDYQRLWDYPKEEYKDQFNIKK